MTNLGRDLDRLNLMQRTLYKAQRNEEAQQVLARVGYTAAEFEVAQALHDAVQPLIEARAQAHQDYLDACEALSTAEADVERDYTIDRAVAKREFEDDPKTMDLLGLLGKQDVSLPGRFEHARKLYTMPLPEENASKMAKGGLTEETRQQRMHAVINTQKRRSEVHEAIIKRETATDTRDAALDKALGWLSNFRKIARKVFKGQDSMLELFELE